MAEGTSPTPPTRPRVRCRDCGRELTATTRDPYGLVGRHRAYFYVRRHNRPDGAPCACDTAWVLGEVK